MEVKILSTHVAEQISFIPTEVRPALTSLFIALALLSVFFFGLLLDLIGSTGVAWEMKLFNNDLNRNSAWLYELLGKQFGEYVGDEFSNILIGFPKQRFMDRLSVWKLSTWKTALQKFRIYSLMKSSQRLQQLLISYALETDHEARVHFLQDKMRLYQVSRSITTVFVILTLELFACHFSNSLHNRYTATADLVVLNLTIYILAGLSIFFTVRSYSRLSITLFALVYTQLKSEEKINKYKARED
jgi:hypothetical protein